MVQAEEIEDQRSMHIKEEENLHLVVNCHIRASTFRRILSSDKNFSYFKEIDPA